MVMFIIPVQDHLKGNKPSQAAPWLRWSIAGFSPRRPGFASAEFYFLRPSVIFFYSIRYIYSPQLFVLKYLFPKRPRFTPI
jgi:hypothetical protein